MKLILTRHGETEENARGICQGWLPGKLSKEGKAQSRLLAERLKDVHIDVIYSSDLARAYDTAVEIAKYHDCELIKEKRLRELNHGKWQGEVVTKEEVTQYKEKRLYESVKGAESFSHAFDRIKNFLEFLLETYDTETVLLVSHGAIGRMTQGAIQGKDLIESLKIPIMGNTAITEYEINKDGTYKIIVENCEEHLEG